MNESSGKESCENKWITCESIDKSFETEGIISKNPMWQWQLKMGKWDGKFYSDVQANQM